MVSFRGEFLIMAHFQGLDGTSSVVPNGYSSIVRQDVAIPRVKMKGKLSINLLSLLIICGTTLPAVAANWGDFRDDGIHHLGDGRYVRIYQAVLWNIPYGQDWTDACSRQPANINGIHFDHPTACLKSSVLQPVSWILGAIGVGALVTPGGQGVGAMSTLGSGVAVILDAMGWGALNVWGIFYVQTNQPPDTDDGGTRNPHRPVD